MFPIRTRAAFLGFLVGVPVLSTAPAQLYAPQAELTPSVRQQAIRPGQAVTLELRFELPEEFHVQSDRPREEYLIPTRLTLTPPEGVTVEEIDYPEASDFLLEGQTEPLAVFEHEFTIEARLAVAEDVSPGELVVPGSVQYQACDDRVCLLPATMSVEWSIRVEPKPL